MSPRSVHALFVVLGTALRWGVKKGYLPFSPMLRVDAPRVAASEITPLTPEQTTTLLDKAAEAGDALVALWTLAAFTGARKSELLGLTWADVDLEAGTLTIRPNAIREVKTPRSRRTLGLADDRRAYTLTDRATLLAFGKRLALRIMVEGDRRLRNVYSVMETNPANGPRVNAAGGRAFADFMVSRDAQEIVRAFGVDRYGRPLFVPNAGQREEEIE